MNLHVRRLAKRLLPPLVTDAIAARRSRQTTAVRAVAARQTYRDDFAIYVAEKRGLTLSEARQLVRDAESQFADGWSGAEYRRFTQTALETLRPFYDECTDAELIDTYRYHAPFDFMRMIGYAVPTQGDLAAIVDRLADKRTIRIVDYGCGLAHRTIAISRLLMLRGAMVKLTLLDIRRQHHFDFLDFVCRQHRIDHDFIEVDADHLYPALPEHDLNDNVSVLEHVRDPSKVIRQTNAALCRGGLFLAAVENEAVEMMHVHPDLGIVRQQIDELGYAPLGRCCGASLFQKPTS